MMKWFVCLDGDLENKIRDGKRINFDKALYPDVVTVSSEGAAAETQSSRMGIYKKMCGVTRNDKPVWKIRGGGKMYLFYTGEHDEIFLQRRNESLQTKTIGLLVLIMLRMREVF